MGFGTIGNDPLAANIILRLGSLNILGYDSLEIGQHIQQLAQAPVLPDFEKESLTLMLPAFIISLLTQRSSAGPSCSSLALSPLSA